LPKKGVYVLQRRSGNKVTNVKTAGRLAMLKPRIVCQVCNNTWLSGIETRAEQAGLGRMIQPHREGEVLLSLGRAEQQALATWAVKVALFHPYTTYPAGQPDADHLRAFYEADRPPLNCAVWLGTYAGTGPYQVIQSGQIRPAGHVVTTFYLGHAMFQVFQSRGTNPYTAKAPSVAYGVLARIWPTQDTAAWPAPPIDGQAFEFLAGLAPPRA
jgi:hypothetical protein